MHPPRVLMAEEILNSKQTVGVGCNEAFVEATFQVLCSLDEGSRQTSSQEVEKFVRLDRAVGGIGAGDEADGPEIAPALPKVVEKPLRPPIEAEHAKQQERPRRNRHSRTTPPAAPRFASTR